MSREALVLLVCCCDFRDGAERLISSKSLRNAVIRAFPGLFRILRMCAPRRAAAVVRPRGREKSADRRRRILISRLLIIRASVPRRKSPFPAYFKGFPAVSPLIPPYPAFLKYPVSPQEARKRPPNDPLHQALLDLQNNRQEEVQATIQALNLVQLRKVLSILRAAEIIEIEANGSSLPVAMDASLKLGSLGKRCMISPVPEKARSFASALTPKDALLLISSAGRCEALETAARAAKKNGTPVILITCDKRSALAGHASYTLLASNRIQRIASDMLPSQLSAALVVEALYYLLLGNFDLN